MSSANSLDPDQVFTKMDLPISIFEVLEIPFAFQRGTLITERHTTLKNHLIQEHNSVHTERPNQARPK